MQIKFLFLVSFLTLFPLLSQAKPIYYGSKVKTVYIVYGEPTLLRFPSLVKTISQANDFEITPADSATPDYSFLSIKSLFRKAKSKVLFVLDNGEVIRVRFVTISKTNSKSDSIYEFKSQKERVSEEATIKTSKVSELDLMKAMIRGDQIANYKMKNKGFFTIHPKVMKGVRATLVRIYQGDKFTGFIYELENRSRFKKATIDVRRLSLGSPNQAVLAQVDDAVLAPRLGKGKSETFLRIVAKANASKGELVLPVGFVKEKSE